MIMWKGKKQEAIRILYVIKISEHHSAQTKMAI